MPRRSSSEGSPEALNNRMVARLLSEPPQAPAEGDYALRVLQTRGRSSGLARRTPIGVLALHGQWWLVSPDRRRDWVANLRADPRCELLAGGQRTPRRAVEAGGDQVGAVVTAYLSLVDVPWARAAFPVSPEASHAELRRHGPAMAVFHLDPPGAAP